MRKFLKSAILALLLLPSLGWAQSHVVPTLDRNNTWTGTNSYTASPQVPEPFGDKDAVPKDYVDSHSGGNLPHVTQQIGGDGAGNGVGIAEKGITVNGSAGAVAWDEDVVNGRFDCRNPAYAGGCLGSTPGLAMQAFRDRLICYQSITGQHAITYFPAATIAVGTPSFPTLTLPAGVTYVGRGGYGFGAQSTVFQASYNHVAAVVIEQNLVSSTACSDGSVHTSTLGSGNGSGFSEHGCGQGGCSNVPGDSNNYPFGGPGQTGISIQDSAGTYGQNGGIYSSNNGDSGTECGGGDTHCYEVGGASNMDYFRFGINVAGQTYNPNSDGWHCNVLADGIDNMFMGPIETYGFIEPPNASYMHICGVLWTGGNSNLGSIFSNRDEIGLVRSTSVNGRAVGGRIDAPMGEGILAISGGNSFSSIDNSSACSGMSGIARGTVFGPYISSLGSGMTPGTYVISATNQSSDTTGSGATLTLTVGSGGTATAVTVSDSGTTIYSATPTFTVTGTGGTPATIGATVYINCDKLEDIGGNSYTNVKNIYEGFFGSDNSTGDIWQVAGNAATFDRGTIGELERPVFGSIVNQGKGLGVHKELLDPAFANGGEPVSGPAVDFRNSNHFVSVDSSATSWTGPFTVSTIMQDLWIYGGNANTTLPESAGWRPCQGYDLNLIRPQWYHFYVFKDDNNSTVGTGYIFIEQCDSINQIVWDVNWQANLANLPSLEQQGVLDIMGSGAFHAVPSPVTFGGQSGGTPGANGVASVNNYVYVVWVGDGKVVSALSATFSQCLPLPGFVNDPCFQNLQFTLPQNWTRYQIYRNTATDSTATAGLIADVTAPGSVPQPPTFTQFEDTRIAPINGTTIPSGWYGATVTGTLSSTGMTIPTASSFPGVPGQQIRDLASGFDYYCDSDDHWKRAAITFSNF